ncbi:MAG TPA: histidine phosphatase family protein [Pseudolabrys sp.]|jgi:phosphohistidine phosphatase|nr:histidine phosphatase family protein [Pseudolabrys sp.]
MRRLLLFRHAKAERSIAGAPDRDRALIERGRKDAAKIGAYMASHHLVPDRVVLSPALRTQETWKAASGALANEPGAISVEKLYDATPHAILGVLKDQPASVHTLMVIGHNPGLHELALMLIASGDIEARERLREKLPTSGLVIIDFAFDDWGRLHPQSGRIERFVSPKMLEAAAN